MMPGHAPGIMLFRATEERPHAVAMKSPVPMSPRLRADRLLVERGLFESRAKAQAAIAAGLVRANGAPVRKPSDEVATTAELQAQPAHPFVSRGGVKLSHALDHAGIAVSGHVCLDVGASTGGFTQVLLERGARLVYAVDVGRGQLHHSLRGRAGIVSLEETDIRTLDPARLIEKPDIVVVDVSFISLKHVLPAALALAAPRTRLLALVKPQFEAPRRAIKKGIVRDSAVQAAVCDDIAAFVRSLGCEAMSVFPAAIAGGDGNQEFFIAAKRHNMLD
jgi:23S rRNA (cytidine1920-2'-O)/16S rRNA (cytidine1409-2'-O)-methyltransferase